MEVVEEKEVGPNDITILKANSTDSLIGWLNENGFKISKESSLVLDDYINSKNFYFIAGKINLENVEEFPEFKSMESKAEEIRNTINKNPELRPYIHPDFHYNLRKVSLDILLNKSWNEINQKFLKSLNISREKYNLIRKNYSVGRNRYGFTDKKTVNQLKKIGGSMEKGYKFEKCLFECVQITNNKVNPSYADYFIICYEPGRIKDERVYWRYELPEHWLRRSGGRNLNCSLADARNFKQINFNKEGSVKTIYNYRNIVKEVSDIKITNLHNETNNTIRDVATSKYKEIEEKLMDFCGEEVYKESNANEVCNPVFEEGCIKKSMQTCINYSLRNGIGTPLKIVFQPENPYYPLKISSINKGETNIKIYVIAPKPVEDINNMLSFEKSYKLGKYGIKELK